MRPQSLLTPGIHVEFVASAGGECWATEDTYLHDSFAHQPTL
jgi:hypothetical protein